jgi:hypothetical protein
MSDNKFIAYEIHPSPAVPIKPARRDRKWMDDTHQKFAYRCLPMVIANQFGWEILSRHQVRATWSGGSQKEDMTVEVLRGDGPSLWSSHFGSGVLTYSIPYLFRTPKDWNLMVRGPTNDPKDGIVGLDGVVETDWAHETFTMNWKFTRACTVEFDIGDPVCLIHPVQRGLLEMFEPEIRSLADDAELRQKYSDWSSGRGRFNEGLAKMEEPYVERGWEKDYFRKSHQTKIDAPAFRRKD